MVKYKIFLFIFLLYLHRSFSIKYHNYTLYRGIPVNDDHLNFFQNLTMRYDVNFWREPGVLNKPVDFVISPADQPSFEKDAIEYGLYLTTIIEDVQEAFDMQTVKSYIRRRTESFDWMNYFRINDIYSWLRDLTNANPKWMTMKSIGKTYENRDIMSVTIRLDDLRPLNQRRSARSTVIIEGGIHAREWVSPAFVTYMINTILHAPYSKDENLRKIAHMYEWHFVPVLNPDGYEYTHTKDRMWRKNRHDGNYGVDINRNFAYGFGSKGISFQQTSDIYCGPKAFSEKESRAMRDFVKANAKNLQYFIAFHSYGQYIIIPYAHSERHVENFDEVRLMARLASREIRNINGIVYTVGTAFDTVGYMTSGISGDWVKNTFGVPYVCTFELRDSGRYGFALPPKLILPTCIETMEGMLSFLTPHGKGWVDRMKQELGSDGQGRTFLDNIVIICNVLLFIIVCFDYFWRFI